MKKIILYSLLTFNLLNASEHLKKDYIIMGLGYSEKTNKKAEINQSSEEQFGLNTKNTNIQIGWNNDWYKFEDTDTFLGTSLNMNIYISSNNNYSAGGYIKQYVYNNDFIAFQIDQNIMVDYKFQFTPGYEIKYVHELYNVDTRNNAIVNSFVSYKYIDKEEENVNMNVSILNVGFQVEY